MPRRRVVISFLVLSLLLTLSGLHAHETENCGGMFCDLLTFFNPLGYPTLLFLPLIHFLVGLIAYKEAGAAFLVVVFLIMLLNFAFSFMLSVGYLRITKKKGLPSNGNLFRIWILYGLLTWVGLSGVYMEKTFSWYFHASSDYRVYACRSTPCFANYLHSKLPTCDGEKTPFLWPFKITLPDVDSCMLDAFIEQQPLKDKKLGLHGSKGVETKVTISIFSPLLYNANNNTRQAFCSTFETLESPPMFQNEYYESADKYCVAVLESSP